MIAKTNISDFLEKSSYKVDILNKYALNPQSASEIASLTGIYRFYFSGKCISKMEKITKNGIISFDSNVYAEIIESKSKILSETGSTNSVSSKYSLRINNIEELLEESAAKKLMGDTISFSNKYFLNNKINPIRITPNNSIFTSIVLKNSSPLQSQIYEISKFDDKGIEILSCSLIIIDEYITSLSSNYDFYFINNKWQEKYSKGIKIKEIIHE